MLLQINEAAIFSTFQLYDDMADVTRCVNITCHSFTLPVDVSVASLVSHTLDSVECFDSHTELAHKGEE